MNPNYSPQLNFILSGDAHAYYAILGIAALALAIAFGASKEFASVIAMLAGGVFVDMWVHGYAH